MEAPWDYGLKAGAKGGRESFVDCEILVSCPRNTRYFVAIKMGRRQGGPSRTGGRREHI